MRSSRRRIYPVYQSCGQNYEKTFNASRPRCSGASSFRRRGGLPRCLLQCRQLRGWQNSVVNSTEGVTFVAVVCSRGVLPLPALSFQSLYILIFPHIRLCPAYASLPIVAAPRPTGSCSARMLRLLHFSHRVSTPCTKSVQTFSASLGMVATSS